MACTTTTSMSRGGKILASRFLDNNSLRCSKTQSHGLMASLRRRKNLLCFYCNKRSDIPYDGLITRWECGKCKAVNFLDENGEITDPQFDTETAAPIDVRYAIPRPDSPSSSPNSDSSRFCATCQKNQRLYTASLAQYDIETDPTHPNYRDNERQYFKFRKGLEKRYPQVCEDCRPGVLEGMKLAGRTARTDFLGKALDRTRARAAASKSLSFSDCIIYGGMLLWYFGLLGQLIWNITALAAIYQHHNPEVLDLLSPSILAFLETTIYVSTSRAWAWYTIICTIISVWWNPMFKQVNNGFMKHIKGLGDWYRFQLVIIVVRLLFYYITGTSTLVDLFSPVSTGAHLISPCFNALLAYRALRCLKIDMSPLWAPTPGSLLQVGPPSRTPSPVQEANSMAAVLDEIAATSTARSYQPAPPPPAPAYPVQDFPEIRPRPRPLPSRQPPPPRSTQLPPRTTPSLLEMTTAESTHYMLTGERPARLQHRYNLNEMEDMEWSPTQEVSQHRAFNPPHSLQRQEQSFGEAPIGDQSSPFWYKGAPPAPISPAQRLRNPPNQPRLQVVSKDAKENFFNTINHRIPVADTAPGRTFETGHQEVDFAQQRFFPPQPPTEAGNMLVDLLAGFSLRDNSVPAEPQAPSLSFGRFALGLVILTIVTATIWKLRFDS